MLQRLTGLVSLDEADHVGVPEGRVVRSLFARFPNHVLQIIKRVDHLADIGVLNVGDGVRRRHGHGLRTIVGAREAIVDAVDIVHTSEWVAVAIRARDA